VAGKAVNAKRPAADLSASGVNWWAGQIRDQRKSSPGRTRTYDPAVNSRLLYQLSYRGMEFGTLIDRGCCGKVVAGGMRLVLSSKQGAIVVRKYKQRQGLWERK
jgi:hypothetical protein